MIIERDITFSFKLVDSGDRPWKGKSKCDIIIHIMEAIRWCLTTCNKMVFNNLRNGTDKGCTKLARAMRTISTHIALPVGDNTLFIVGKGCTGEGLHKYVHTIQCFIQCLNKSSPSRSNA